MRYLFNPKVRLLGWVVLLGLLALASCQPAAKTAEQSHPWTALTPPDVDKKPKELTTHGDTRTDNYYWLNDREDAQVISYLEAENAYTQAALQHTEPLQEQLFEEMTSRLEKDDASVPALDNGYYYYSRYEEGREYPLYCRKKGSLEAQEEVILNVNELAAGKEYCAVNSWSVSPDNNWLAFGIDTVSRRQYGIRLKNLKTGEYLPQELRNTTGGATWAADSQRLFYNAKEEGTLRSYKVFRYRVGTAPASAAEVFHEEDNTFSCYVFKSRADRFIMIGSSTTISDEYYFLPADQPEGKFQVIQPRERGLEYSVSHQGDRFLIRTNWEAENFRLMEAPIASPGKENWKELIAHSEEVYLSDVDAFQDYLVLSERKDGLVQLHVYDLKGGTDHYISFQDAAYSTYTTSNAEYDTQTLRFGYA